MEANVSSQLVVMTKDDLDAALNNAAMRISSSNKPTQQSLMTSKEVQSLGKDDEYLSRKEAASMLKVDFSTLWRWNNSGLLPAIKVGPRKVMYRYSDILTVLEGKSCNNRND